MHYTFLEILKDFINFYSPNYQFCRRKSTACPESLSFASLHIRSPQDRSDSAQRWCTWWKIVTDTISVLILSHLISRFSSRKIVLIGTPKFLWWWIILAFFSRRNSKTRTMQHATSRRGRKGRRVRERDKEETMLHARLPVADWTRDPRVASISMEGVGLGRGGRSTVERSRDGRLALDRWIEGVRREV